MSLGEGTASSGDRPVLVQENIAKLQMAGEVGQHMIPAYLAALQTDPRLSGVMLVPYRTTDVPELANTPGMASPPHVSVTGRAEVWLNVDGWQQYAKFLTGRRGAVEAITRKLGMQADDMDARTFATFASLHELGHAREYFDEDFNPEESDKTHREELETLPVAGLSPSILITWIKRHPIKARRHIRGNRERLKGLGIQSVPELIAAQESAYRQLPSEDRADQFAAQIMLTSRVDQSAAADGNRDFIHEHPIG